MYPVWADVKQTMVKLTAPLKLHSYTEVMRGLVRRRIQLFQVLIDCGKRLKSNSH